LIFSFIFTQILLYFFSFFSVYRFFSPFFYFWFFFRWMNWVEHWSRPDFRFLKQIIHLLLIFLSKFRSIFSPSSLSSNFSLSLSLIWNFFQINELSTTLVASRFRVFTHISCFYPDFVLSSVFSSKQLIFFLYFYPDFVGAIFYCLQAWNL